MRTNKVKGQLSIETKVFKVLKDIGVELTSYHGGSLNGKDIKKVMNNASHVFDCISVEMTARSWMRKSNRCASIFVRYLCCGMEHICRHGL